MIVNKKLDRFKQWAGERMGGEVKTSTTDNFKALELEMELRHKGIEKMSESTNAYIKAVSRRTEAEKKEKTLPIAHMGGSMIAHSEDFEHDSEFGQCLGCKYKRNTLQDCLLTSYSLRENTRTTGPISGIIYHRRH